MDAGTRRFKRGQRLVLKRGKVFRQVTFVSKVSKTYSKVINDAGYIEVVMSFQLGQYKKVKAP